MADPYSVLNDIWKKYGGQGDLAPINWYTDQSEQGGWANQYMTDQSAGVNNIYEWQPSQADQDAIYRSARATATATRPWQEETPTVVKPFGAHKFVVDGREYDVTPAARPGGGYDWRAPGAEAIPEAVQRRIDQFVRYEAPQKEPGGNLLATIGNIASGGLTNLLGVTDVDNPVNRVAGWFNPMNPVVEGSRIAQHGDLYAGIDRALDLPGGWWQTGEAGTGGAIDQALRGVGGLLPENLRDVAPAAGSVLGGIAGSYIPVIGTAAGAAIGSGIGGKLANPDDYQGNLTRAAATYVTAEALSALANQANAPLADADEIDIALMEAEEGGKGTVLSEADWSGTQIGPEGAPIDATPAGTGQINIQPLEVLETQPSLSLADTLRNAVLDPNTYKAAAKLGATVLSLAPMLGGGTTDIAGEPLPPMPALDTEPMPALLEGPPELPEAFEGEPFPEGPEFPEWRPSNWKRMSKAEREAWLINRGGEASKRRRGIWAGNLASLRSRKTGAGMDYAELTPATGKTVLGE